MTNNNNNNNNNNNKKNSFFSKEESLSLASCGTYTSHNITDCLFGLLCSSCKLESAGMVGSSVGVFLMSSCGISVSSILYY